MDNWQKVRLGEVMDVAHGFAFPGDSFSDDPSFPILVTPGNFSIGGGFKQAKCKTFLGDYPKRYELAPGALIISMTDLSKDSDTLGLPALIPSDGKTYLHNQRVGLVKILDSRLANSDFLNYFLRGQVYRSHILSTASGSTVKHTSPKRILAYVATLPLLSQQEAIAETLRAIDDKIQVNTAITTIAETLSTAMTEQVVEKTILADLIDLSREMVSPEKLSTDPVWHYSLPAYDAGRLATRDLPGTIKSGKFGLQHPAVLVSKLNPQFPRVWCVSQPKLGLSVTSTEFIVMQPKISTPEFLWSLLVQPSFGAALRSKVAGTSGSHQRVRPDDMLKIRVGDPRAAPPRLVDAVTQTVRLAQHVREENVTLAALRDTLLPELMSGRMRVRDAEEQVGEVL